MLRWLNELGKEDKDLAGKKCANLGEMIKAGVNTPPGFALTLEAYDRFIRATGAIEEIRRYLATFTANPNNPADMPKYDKASKVIRDIVVSKDMPKDMNDAIRQYYDQLCEMTGISDVPVATRSAGPASHPGQYETYLHVSGSLEVMKNIVKVWSSTFNQRSIIARARLGLPLEYDPIGVAVLKMINAKAAGVIFTLNPINGDISKIAVGGNWGLGEAVVSGEVTNDQWMLDKVTLEIIERRVSPKAIEYIVEPETGEVITSDIPPERRTRPCLTDDELLELAGQAKRIEQHFGVAQDIEWVIDKDLPLPQNIFFVQTRPETIWSKAEGKPTLKPRKTRAEWDITTLIEKIQKE